MRISSSRLTSVWSSLGKHTSIYLVASLVTAALPFLLLPVLTRQLGPADYGRAAMFSVLVTTVSQLIGLGAHGALGVRKFELSPRSFAAYIRACLIILSASAVALVPLTLVLAKPLTAATGLPLTWLEVAVLAASAQGLLQLTLAVWVAESRSVTYGIVQIGQMTANLVLSLIFVVTLSLGWQGRALGVSVAVTLGAIVALAVLRSQHDLRRHPEVPAHRRDALRFGLPLVPHALGGLLMLMTDRFIVSSLLGAKSVGVYMVAVQLGLGMSLLVESFNRAYAPWLMRRLAAKPTAEAAARLVRTTYACFAGLLFAATLVGIIAAPVVQILAGDEFVGSASLVKFIAVGCAFTGCYYLVTNYVFFAGATRALAAITLSVGVLNIPLTWGLVRAHGVTGAAIAYAITQLASFVATWWLANRSHPMPWFGRGTSGVRPSMDTQSANDPLRDRSRNAK